MASREWMITKIVATILGVVTLVSICVGAANLVVNLQSDVDRIDSDVEKHIDNDMSKWESIEDDMDSVVDDVHALELKQAKTEANYQEIMRMLEQIQGELKRLEVVNGN